MVSLELVGELAGFLGLHFVPWRLAMYFAVSNFDVAISINKRKLRKFAKKSLRFAGLDLQLGYCNRQVFSNPESFKQEFGSCIIYDLDQRLVFRPDFSVVRSF